MSSVLFGNTGYSDGNRLRSEFTRLQNQINSLKQDNQFLMQILSATNPTLIKEFTTMKEEAAAKVAADAEAARQEAARQRAMNQTTAFNRR